MSFRLAWEETMILSEKESFSPLAGIDVLQTWMQEIQD